jgi:hypothetical protein
VTTKVSKAGSRKLVPAKGEVFPYREDFGDVIVAT